jgi:hypothetical protein
MSQSNTSPNATQSNDIYERSGGESSEAIKRRIEGTREAMDETLDELGNRLNPHSLLDDAMEIFRSPRAQETAKKAGGALSDFAQNLGRQVRDNPIPTLLVGAGLAWIAFSSQDEGDDEDHPAHQRSKKRAGRSVWNRTDWDVDAESADWYTQTSNDSGSPDFEEGQVPRGYSAQSQHAGFVLPEAYGQTGDRTAGNSGKSQSTVSKVRDKASQLADSASTTASSLGSSVAQAAGAAKETIADGAARIGSAFASTTEETYDAAKHGYQAARQGVQQAYRGVSKSGRAVGRSAQWGYRNGLHQVNDAYEFACDKVHAAHVNYPLGVGLGFLALGALTGLAIPRTRQEDELMGESSEQVRESVWHSGEQAVEQVVEQGKEVVHETVETLKKSAEEHELTGEKLSEKISRVAHKGSEAVAQSAKEEGLQPSQLAKDVKEVARDTTDKASQEVKSIKPSDR